MIGIGDSDEGGDAGGAGEFVAHHGTVAGEGEGADGASAGIDVFATEFMGGEGVADTADDGEQVGALGEFGEVFTDLDAGDIAGDGFEFATDVIGGVGFGIEGIEVGGATVEFDEDGGLSAAEG